MLYEKTQWDYFCELLAVVPGMAAMFEDGGARCRGPEAGKAAFRAEGGDREDDRAEKRDDRE